MAGPEGENSGKGKGKGKSRDGGGSSAAREERTPSPNHQGGSRTSGMRLLALRLCSSASAGDVDAPRRKTVCAFAVIVSVLALLRHLLLPLPSGYAGAGGEEVPTHLEGDLIRLVLAEQLEGVANTMQREARVFENLHARRGAALREIKGFEERLKATVSELEELEGLGKAVHEDNSGDAGLFTEVSRAQDRLRDLHRSVAGKLDSFKRQLEDQAETMRGVRAGWAKIGQVPERTGDRIAAGAVHEKLEEKLEQYLEELMSFHREYEANVDSLSPDIITADDLEDLLEHAAEPSEASGDGSDGSDEYGPDDEETIRSLSEEAVHLTVQKILGGGGESDGDGGDGGDGDDDGGCVSEEGLRKEVDAAIRKLMADGTGRRDYANAALGGKVLKSKGMVSDTYTPPAWWAPSWYWHRAGVENGIGPVESVISEDSSFGACWAMDGSEGLVTIQLPKEVAVDGISVEHASRMITTETSSAPREFQVVGMRNANDKYPIKLAGGVYEIDGRPIQTFPIDTRPPDVKFKVIQVKILSNWGNPDYTCLYRVRVHGSEN